VLKNQIRTLPKALLIAPMAEMRDDNDDLAIPSGALEAICPHCGLQSSYRSEEIRIEKGQQIH
jgi:hypothetical protein